MALSMEVDESSAAFPKLRVPKPFSLLLLLLLEELTAVGMD